MKKTKYFLLLITTLLSFSLFSQNNEKLYEVKSVKIKGVDVEYETFGVGKPILMIHGFGIDRELLKGCMEPIFENKESWKRIYFDLPGMGKTPVPTGYKNSNDMLEFIRKFIKKVIPKQKFVLVGNSYGGYLARSLVYLTPHNIEGLLLICPVNILDRTKRQLPKFSVFERDTSFYEKLKPQYKQLIDVFLVAQTKEKWKRMETEIIPSFAKRDIRFLNILQKSENYQLTFNINKATEFNKPTLILSGRQDNIVGYKDTYTYLDKLPRATFAVLDMASHNLQIEQEVLFNSLVNELLIRIIKNQKHK